MYTLLSLLALSLLASQGPVLAFNAPPDVPTWCGKPYMSTNHSLDPGGQFQFPTPQSDPLLYLSLEPRYSIFLESDGSGSLLIDASISYLFGGSYKNITYDTPGNNNVGTPFVILEIEIYNENTGALLVTTSLPVNSTANIIEFPFASFTPRLSPYTIAIYGTSPDGQQTYSASTEIYVLPARTYGSAVKIDNLYGGLYVQNAFNSWTGWYAVFPNGYYADGSYVSPSNISLAHIDAYSELGLNTINIVPDGGLPDQGYPIAELATYWDEMDRLNLFNIFDMRYAFQNSTRIKDQVTQWLNRTTLLMWYTADEPDGWSYDLNSTTIAYDHLKELDPYHPVSLVLNCQNFYYQDYSAGADIIFEDAYPVAINATWSIPWSTPVNSTYGDCGCDNCIGALSDVSSRLDGIQAYQAALPNTPRKPTWAVLQAFGDQDYWASIPSAAEVETMMMLAINHNAKGITYWIYPSTSAVNDGSAALGSILTTAPARDFIFGANAIKNLPVAGTGSGEPQLLDASAWIPTNATQMMVGIANGEYVDSTGEFRIALPMPARDIECVLFGNGAWTLDLNSNELVRDGLAGLEIDILVLDL